MCRCQQLFHMFDQFADKAIRHIQFTLIFGQVALLVRLIQQQPLLWLEAQGMFETLENQIAVVAAVAMLAQCR